MNTAIYQLNQVKSFDIVFIGHLASVAAYLFSIATKDQYKSLVLHTQSKIIQPSLLPLFYDQIKIKKKLKKPSIFHKQLKIANIKPIAKQIQLEGGKTYDYKYLVYSGNINDWLDFDTIKTLNQALSNEYSLVYSNIKKRDLSNVYNQSYGNIVFYIPNGKHFGYDNINFLLIYKKFIQTRSCQSQNQYKAMQFKVILEGSQFYPHCKQADQLLKKEIRDLGIQIYYNSKLEKIDYLRRTLTINGSYEISYNIFYCIIPQKIPDLLKKAQIDPYNLNPRTLMNKKYKNIFVFGADILPTTHTFQAIQYQNHIICKNLQHLLQKSGYISLYNGHTKIPIYLNNKQIIQIQHFYNKKQSFSSQSQQSQQTLINQKCSIFTFYLNRLAKYYLTESYYNYKSCGSPYYIFSPNEISVKFIQEEKIDQTSPLVGNNRKQDQEQSSIINEDRPHEIIFNQTEERKPKNVKQIK